MKKNSNDLISMIKSSDWVTVQEAVLLMKQLTNNNFNVSDIYRHALSGNIYLSIYFQSPVFLRQVIQSEQKIKLKLSETSLIHQLCYLESECFIKKIQFITSTEGKYFLVEHDVIDTSLIGYEFVVLQRLLARSLKLPLPIKRKYCMNHGISVFLSGNTYQIFEKMTWQERIKHQTVKLPINMAKEINEYMTGINNSILYQREYFPLHDLPGDACFVIRRTEIEKLLALYTSVPASTRTSSALARFFWLACWHNEAIRSLIGQPYKLLSIFEQWALEDGITDKLSGDTLKAVLERGCPFPDGQRR
ncbi:hypothetical protein GP301_004899 [Salmonella enterica]|nr:hypothetical protein [Salmonella enterica]EDY5959451.1 hypothetical protein [Salmonella enterica]EFT8163459.1 hypothetical protein [Salmonella enterica]EGS6515267.1 hypothetical protein [Salmonella enterica]EIQ2980867.1 hypothetical protein [Salmonella enterica]